MRKEFSSISVPQLRVEYKVVNFDCTYASNLEAELNKLGREGFKIMNSSFVENGGFLHFRAVLQREVVE